MIFNCSNSNPVNIGSSTEQFAFSSSSCVLIDSASSTPEVAAGFTKGDILIGFLLFILITISLVYLLIEELAGIKIQDEK